MSEQKCEYKEYIVKKKRSVHKSTTHLSLCYVISFTLEHAHCCIPRCKIANRKDPTKRNEARHLIYKIARTYYIVKEIVYMYNRIIYMISYIIDH